MRLRKDHMAAVLNHILRSGGRRLFCPCCGEDDFYYQSDPAKRWHWRCHACWFRVAVCVKGWPDRGYVLQIDGPVAEEDR